jgi:UrcA family protein
MTIQLAFASLLAACGLAAATGAAANPLAAYAGAPGGHGPVKVLVIVSSHGLDLSSERGADLFLRRLDAAVDQACNDRPSGPLLLLSRTSQYYACHDKALHDAMAYVHSPLVRQRFAQLGAASGVRVARR